MTVLGAELQAEMTWWIFVMLLCFIFSIWHPAVTQQQCLDATCQKSEMISKRKKHGFGVGFIAAPWWQCQSTGIRVLDPWNWSSGSSVFRVSISKRSTSTFMSPKKKEGGVGFLQSNPPDSEFATCTWSLAVASLTEQTSGIVIRFLKEHTEAIYPGRPASSLFNHSNGF